METLVMPLCGPIVCMQRLSCDYHKAASTGAMLVPSVEEKDRIRLLICHWIGTSLFLLRIILFLYLKSYLSEMLKASYSIVVRKTIISQNLSKKNIKIRRCFGWDCRALSMQNSLLLLVGLSTFQDWSGDSKTQHPSPGYDWNNPGDLVKASRISSIINCWPKNLQE